MTRRASLTARPYVVNPNPAHYPESTTTLRWATTAWPGALSYNPYNPNVIPNYQFAIMSLAAYSNTLRPGKNPFLPEVAKGWTVGKHSITFHIRPAKWQNGKPITTTDVLDSMYLSGINGNAVWADVTSMSAPNSHDVLFKLHSWVITENIMEEIFQVPIIPASQYGFLIPHGIAKDLSTYWSLYDFLHPSQATIQKASSSPAGKTISAAQTKLVKFNPKKLIGNGPYSVKSKNLSGVLYKKWMGWWDAKAISAPWQEMTPINISDQFGALLDGTADFQTDTQFPDPQVARMKISQYGHYVFIPSPVQVWSLGFHFADYPYNLLPVRKAFAYLIDRPRVCSLDIGGSLAQNPPVIAPDGVNQQMAKHFLTHSQMAKLNHYNYSPSKATSLLRGAGFTKKGGHWYTPRGNLWKVTIFEPATVPNSDEDGIVISDALKKFGIVANTQDTNVATYGSQEEAGDYPVWEELFDWGGTPNPIGDFAATFAPAELPAFNYPISYNGAGKFNGHVGIGIGPIQNVPGLGKVNIGAALNSEVNTAPKRTWAKYTWDWARWINQQLPIDGICNNAFHEAYGTSRYVDFPPKSKKWLWTGLGGAPQTVMMMQAGYIKMPRH